MKTKLFATLVILILLGFILIQRFQLERLEKRLVSSYAEGMELISQSFHDFREPRVAPPTASGGATKMEYPYWKTHLQAGGRGYIIIEQITPEGSVTDAIAVP